MTFYDELAAEYDDITRGRHRSTGAREFIAECMRRYTVRSAVDVACGTGLYALALAEQGVDTIGADLSMEMLRRAAVRADEANLSIKWIQTSMQELTAHLETAQDAVLCMGNSLAHLLDDEDLDATLSAFHASLTAEGLLVMHLLNYDRILTERERIVGITRTGDREYLRFYDFFDNRVRFNVLRIQWKDGQCRHLLHSTILRPYRWHELRDSLARHGFTDVAAHGDLEFGPFSSDSSDSLLITAKVQSPLR